MLTSLLNQTAPTSTQNTAEPVVKVEGLNHYFGEGSLRRQVLFDINFVLHPGEIVLLTGPSGSGKTTLLTLLGALRSVQEGSLQVLGQELRGAKPSTLVQVRRKIGYIFQAHNLLRSPDVSPECAHGPWSCTTACLPRKLNGGQKQCWQRWVLGIASTTTRNSFQGVKSSEWRLPAPSSATPSWC
jgi:hypothetical protein